MIQAFDAIEAAGDISPTLVAGGIKVALLTTAAGLLAGIILQVGYNYCVSKIARIIWEMEESSVILIDSIISLREGGQAVTEDNESAAPTKSTNSYSSTMT